MAWCNGIIPTSVVQNVPDYDPKGMKIRMRMAKDKSSDIASQAKKYIGGPGRLYFFLKKSTDSYYYVIEEYLEPNYLTVPKFIEELNMRIVDMGEALFKGEDEQLRQYLPQFRYEEEWLRLIDVNKKPDTVDALSLEIRFDPNLECALHAFNFDWDYNRKQWWKYGNVYAVEVGVLAGDFNWDTMIRKAKYPVTKPDRGALKEVFYFYDETVTVTEEDLLLIDTSLTRENQLDDFLKKVIFKPWLDRKLIQKTKMKIDKKGIVTCSVELMNDWHRLTLDLSPSLMELFQWGGPTTIAAVGATNVLAIQPPHQPEIQLYKNISPPYDWAILSNQKLALHIAGPEPFSKLTSLPLQFTYHTLGQPRLTARLTQPLCSDDLIYCAAPVANFTLPASTASQQHCSYDLSTLSFEMEARLLNESGLSMAANEEHQTSINAHQKIISDVQITLGSHILEHSNNLRPVRDRMLQLIYSSVMIDSPLSPDCFHESRKVLWSLNLFRFETAPKEHLMLSENLEVKVSFTQPEAYIEAAAGSDSPPKRYLKILDSQLKLDRAVVSQEMYDSMVPAFKRHTPTYKFTRCYMEERILPKGSNHFVSKLFDDTTNVKRFVLGFQSTKKPANWDLRFKRHGVVSIILKQNGVNVDDPILIGTGPTAYDQVAKRWNAARLKSGLPAMKLNSESLMIFIFNNTAGSRPGPVMYDIIFNHPIEEDVRLVSMTECEETLSLGVDKRVRRCTARALVSTKQPPARKEGGPALLGGVTNANSISSQQEMEGPPPPKRSRVRL